MRIKTKLLQTIDVAETELSHYFYCFRLFFGGARSGWSLREITDYLKV